MELIFTALAWKAEKQKWVESLTDYIRSARMEPVQVSEKCHRLLFVPSRQVRVDGQSEGVKNYKYTNYWKHVTAFTNELNPLTNHSQVRTAQRHLDLKNNVFSRKSWKIILVLFVLCYFYWSIIFSRKPFFQLPMTMSNITFLILLFRSDARFLSDHLTQQGRICPNSVISLYMFLLQLATQKDAHTALQSHSSFSSVDASSP